jgi:hypothetical protein
MATTSIELDIENITGVSDADDQYIISAQKYAVASVPKELLKWAITETVAASHGGNNSNQQITLPVKTDSLVYVRRDQFEASLVDSSMRGFIGNSNSLHLATDTFPKYYIADGNRVIVKPDPDNTYTAHAQYVDFSKIDDDSDLRNAVIFHAAAKEFSQLATDETAPTYTAPVLEASTSFSNFSSGLSETDPGVFSLTAVEPSAPSDPSFSTPAIDTITISNLGIPPTYTAPVVGGVSEELTTTLTATTSDGYGTDADFRDFSMWFTTVGELIEDEEDIELAGAQIQKISAYIQAYSGAMQNQLNIFNDANTEYQGKLQEAIQQSQINAQETQSEASLLLQKENQEYGAKLQKYSSNLNKYQADVTKEVQEYQQKLSQYQLELSTSSQAWQKQESDKVSRYQSEVQNSLNIFNKENAVYTQRISYYEGASDKYYQWAQSEIMQYIQNNSKMIERTMAMRSRNREGRPSRQRR